MPKVSIVIPTYNRAHFITESIQSVLAQTFTDFEIVVVDDGSIDNTKEVVNNFQDPRIKYTYQENQGVAAASNRGFKLSRGKYIAFFSSDDILIKDAVEKGVQVLDRHPEVAFSYGRAYLMDERGHVFGLRKLKNKRSGVWGGTEEINKFLLYGNRIPVPTIMVRRAYHFEAGLFDPTFRYGISAKAWPEYCGCSEDVDLLIRLAKRYSVAYIAEPLAKIRQHSGSISSNRNIYEEEQSNTRVIERIFNDAELEPLLSSQRPKVYFRLYVRLARQAYDIGERGIARELLFRALKIHFKGLFESMWPYWFAQTFIPLQLMCSVRKARLYLHMGILSVHNTIKRH